MVAPGEWQGDVALADGGTVHVRPVGPEDADRLVRFHGRQSPESIYLRFFTALPILSARQVARFTTVDHEDRMAFVALLGDEMVGIAGWDRLADGRAEVALSVDDEHRGRGVGTVLLEWLAAAAREVGITRFVGLVLPSNRRMLGVFGAAGFEVSTRFTDGVVEVVLDVEPTETARAAIDERERRAEARSVARVLAPRTVAVVGAGRRPGTVGHEAFRLLLSGGFEGAVYPVNLSAHHVASVRAWPSVLDVPDELDLAVVAVPPAAVAGVVEECAAKRVRAIVVLTTDVPDHDALVATARGHGMRLVGPGSLGVLNTDADVRLHATFVPVGPEPGRVAICSQSGPLGAAILERLRALGIGVAAFVDAGDKADVSANDLLQYWEGDDRTGVVLLYLESFGNPRKFARIARRLTRAKPVVAVAGGAGRADALLGQLGVIRVESLDRLLDVARVLDGRPVPAGRRVAIVSNTTGPAALAAEGCRAAGLDVVADVVLDAVAGPDAYREAVAAVVAGGGADSALVLYAPQLRTPSAVVLAAVAGAAGDLPVVASCFGTLAPEDRRRAGVPEFTFPDDAAAALGRVAAYGEWRSRPAGREVRPDGVDDDGAAAVVARALAARPGGTVLSAADAFALVGVAAGAPVARHRLVRTADEAVAAAAALGGPVAVKATGLPHLAKTEAGGLALDVTGPGEVRDAYERMSAALGDAMRPALVQEMVATGVDLSVAVEQGEAVGPVVLLGRGGAGFPPGTAGEVAGAVPLTDVDAERMVDAAPGPVPDGARAALVDLLLRLSHLADTVPGLAEVRCNPVIASAAGVAVVDVRARVAPAPARASLPDLRRLG